MPCVGYILRQDKLPIIADPTTDWKSRSGFGKKVMTGSGRKADVPHLVGTETGASAERGMVESGLRNPPGFWPGSQPGVLHFRGVIEPAGTAGDRYSARVARTPNDGKTQIFIGVIVIVVRADMGPAEEIIGVIRRGGVPNAGQVFVGQWRINEWILPA